MQNSASEPLDSDKRKMHSEQYDTPHPPDGRTWVHMSKLGLRCNQRKWQKQENEKSKTTAGITDLQDQIKSS